MKKIGLKDLSVKSFITNELQGGIVVPPYPTDPRICSAPPRCDSNQGCDLPC